jgi:SAM-dependent methyltransferase
VSTLLFDDSAGYERFMGRWSRAAAPVFLDWLGVPPGARWLDVGCGTGILAEAVLQRCAPVSVHAIDPAPAQIAATAARTSAGAVRYLVADAQRLPFDDGSFDVVASALVVNFIPDRTAAMLEMRRTARDGGCIAAYVWAFDEDLSPSGPLRRAMLSLGIDVPPIPGVEASGIAALQVLFAAAGLVHIETCTIEVCLGYTHVADFWQSQTPSYAPTTKLIAAMDEKDRARLMKAVDAAFPAGPGRGIEYTARANAIKARVPARTMRPPAGA